MTHNDYRTYILTCEYLNREPTGQYKKVHDFLTGLWDSMGFVVDSRNNCILFQKGGERFMEHNHKNGFLWCQNERVWSFFVKDMGMVSSEIQDFMRSVVGEHLKCQVETPERGLPVRVQRVEEHLNCIDYVKVMTTLGTPVPEHHTP